MKMFLLFPKQIFFSYGKNQMKLTEKQEKKKSLQNKKILIEIVIEK